MPFALLQPIEESIELTLLEHEYARDGARRMGDNLPGIMTGPASGMKLREFCLEVAFEVIRECLESGFEVSRELGLEFGFEVSRELGLVAYASAWCAVVQAWLASAVASRLVRGRPSEQAKA